MKTTKDLLQNTWIRSKVNGVVLYKYVHGNYHTQFALTEKQDRNKDIVSHAMNQAIYSIAVLMKNAYEESGLA